MTTMNAMGQMMVVSRYADPYWSQVISYRRFRDNLGATTYVDEVPGKSWAGGISSSISGAQSKFWDRSLYVAPTGVASLTPSAEWVFPGDFSLEGWVYCNSAGGVGALFSVNTSVNFGYSLTIGSGGTSINGNYAGISVGVGDGAGSIYNRWVHAFFGKQGSTLYVACNGVMSTTSTGLTIGGTASSVSGGSLANTPGAYIYINEARVTAGRCRYTSSFTPPTAPFPNA